MRFFLSVASKGGSQGRQGVTQPFFKLHIPDFAWKFVWIVSTNFEQNENLQKKFKNVKRRKEQKK